MSDMSSWCIHAAIRLLFPGRGTWHRKWTDGSLLAPSISLGINDQFMDVALSTSLCIVLQDQPCQGCLRVPAQEGPHSELTKLTFPLAGFWIRLFPSWCSCDMQLSTVPYSVPFLVHCILLEQNLPTDMYRFSVLLIKDISELPVFTKESNHALTSLCVCSDLHCFAQAFAKAPCSEQW